MLTVLWKNDYMSIVFFCFLFLHCLLKNDLFKCFIPDTWDPKERDTNIKNQYCNNKSPDCISFRSNLAGGFGWPRKLKANWMEQHVCWFNCCRFFVCLPSLLISQLGRVEQNFFAFRGLRGEKTRSNLCIYVIALSCLKGPFQVGNLRQNQHLESQKSSCLRHLAGNYLRVLPTFLSLGRKSCPSRSGFLAPYIFALSLVLWTDILIQSRIAQPSLQSWSSSQGPQAGPGPGLIHRGPSLFLSSSSSLCLTGDSLRSCVGSAASLCLSRRRNTLLSDVQRAETLQLPLTD